MEDFSKVSWIAVIVGTIASFLVGWAWYSPKLFGKVWAKGSGVELGKAGEVPVFAMVSQLVALLVLALVIGITATFNHLITAILAILAVAIWTVSAGAYVKKSGGALAVEFFYVIAAGIVMIVFQGIF